MLRVPSFRGMFCQQTPTIPSLMRSNSLMAIVKHLCYYVDGFGYRFVSVVYLRLTLFLLHNINLGHIIETNRDRDGMLPGELGWNIRGIRTSAVCSRPINQSFHCTLSIMCQDVFVVPYTINLGAHQSTKLLLRCGIFAQETK